MTKLYDLANNYQTTLDNLCDEETGEIDEQQLEALNTISQDVKEKGIAIATYLRNIDADKEALDNECRRLSARKAQLARRIEWLNIYLKTNMEACAIQEISCPLFSIKLRKNNPSVNVVDEALVPAEYMRQKTTESLDKIQILSDLKNGVFIPGVELKQGTRLEIR